MHLETPRDLAIKEIIGLRRRARETERAGYSSASLSSERKAEMLTWLWSVTDTELKKP